MSVPILQTKKEVCLEPLSCSVPTNFPEREFPRQKINFYFDFQDLNHKAIERPLANLNLKSIGFVIYFSTINSMKKKFNLTTVKADKDDTIMLNNRLIYI